MVIFEKRQFLSLWSPKLSYHEAGYVYGQNIERDGETGTKTTGGRGGPSAKDALISLSVKAAGERAKTMMRPDNLLLDEAIEQSK